MEKQICYEYNSYCSGKTGIHFNPTRLFSCAFIASCELGLLNCLV
jgi:hypothetical protein